MRDHGSSVAERFFCSPALPRLYPLNVLGHAVAAAVFALQGPLIPTPIGVGPRFHPPSAQHGGCRGTGSARDPVHLEVFARRRVVIVPQGICSPTVRTTAPTGVIDVEGGGRVTLGDFFDAWNQRLSRRRLASFRGQVRAYVSGEEWRGGLRAIPLSPHAQIVLEVGPRVPPHRFFLFGSRA